MADAHDSTFKREEDREWRTKVNHELVSLMTGHQVLDARMDDLNDEVKEIDATLRGDAKEDLEGLLAQVHRIQTELSRLNSVVFVDSTGRSGIMHDVEALKKRERTEVERWKFWTAIIVAFIMTVGVIVTNLDRIESFFRPHTDQSTPKKKTRRPPKRVVEPRENASDE